MTNDKSEMTNSKYARSSRAQGSRGFAIGYLLLAIPDQLYRTVPRDSRIPLLSAVTLQDNGIGSESEYN